MKRPSPLKRTSRLSPVSKRKRSEAVKVYDDGREVCDIRTAAGMGEYQRRIRAMLRRQRGMCCLFGHAPDCVGYIDGAMPTFEHQDGRGMGGAHRDDRIELPDGTWINGAAHIRCNSWKGSRRIDYNTALQAKAGGL